MTTAFPTILVSSEQGYRRKVQNPKFIRTPFNQGVKVNSQSSLFPLVYSDGLTRVLSLPPGTRELVVLYLNGQTLAPDDYTLDYPSLTLTLDPSVPLNVGDKLWGLVTS